MQVEGFFFLIIAALIGFAAVKLGLLPKNSAAMSQLLMNICYPALIIVSVSGMDLKQYAGEGAVVAAVTVALGIILFFAGKLMLMRFPKGRALLLRFFLGVGNVTCLGIPLLSLMFGPTGVLYATLHGSIQDIFIWLVYYPVFLKKKQGKALKLLTSPCIISLIVGVALYFLKPYFTLPHVIAYSLEKIASMTTPLAMLFVGALLAGHGFSEWIPNFSVVAMSVFKVILMPAALFFLLSVFYSPQLSLSLAVLYGCPAPVIGLVWAKSGYADVTYAIKLMLFSTVLFVVAFCPLAFLAQRYFC